MAVVDFFFFYIILRLIFVSKWLEQSIYSAKLFSSLSLQCDQNLNVYNSFVRGLIKSEIIKINYHTRKSDKLGFLCHRGIKCILVSRILSFSKLLKFVFWNMATVSHLCVLPIGSLSYGLYILGIWQKRQITICAHTVYNSPRTCRRRRLFLFSYTVCVLYGRYYCAKYYTFSVTVYIYILFYINFQDNSQYNIANI